MTVSSYLKNLSDKAIIRDQEKESITTSIATIKHRLDRHFGDSIKDQFIFGSFTRKTILPRSMDPRSDIDYMIVFSEDDVTPQSYLNRLKTFASTNYKTSEIRQSHPTIKLNLNHITFELVPALESFLRGYRIPARNYLVGNWMDTDPNDFNSDLTDKNTNHCSLIKPVIRLMKYWNARNGYVYESFELEKLIIEHDFFSFNAFLKLDLKWYFFQCIDDLSTWRLTERGKSRVNRAKAIITQVKQLEAKGNPAMAESRIRQLLPELSGVNSLAAALLR